MSKIKVLIVDDYDMVRRGLVVLLENFDELALIGEARDGQAAFNMCRRARPDVILMDIVMPVMDGITAIRRIRQVYPEIQIIALTSFEDEVNVRKAIQAGAISYLMKNVSGVELVDAIQKAHNGQSTLASAAVQALMHAKTESFGADLTEREREVLALVAEGLTNREIAQRLEISPSTVKEHVSNILDKLDVANRTEAAKLAIERNLVF